MNTYRYSLTIIDNGETRHTALHVGMTYDHRKIFNYCLRNNQKEGLAPLYEYIYSSELKLANKDIVPFDDEDDNKVPDFIYSYSGNRKVYIFYTISDNEEDIIPIYIQIDEIFFDGFNDMANLGDVPERLIEIIDSKMEGKSPIYRLECDDEVDNVVPDYCWKC